MSSLRGQYRRFKKPPSNPYAGRGLDKFALVSAELEAKREELAEQLDTPLSMVKFAIGSHNRWIPIVLSRSTKKGSYASKKKSGGLITEDKSTSKGTLRKGDKGSYGAGSFDKEQARSRSEDTPIDERQRGSVTNRNRADSGGKIHVPSTQLSDNPTGITVPSDDGASLDGRIRKGPITMGGSPGLRRSELDESIEILPAPSELDHTATNEAESDRLQAHNAKSSGGASWLVSKASTLASNVILLGWPSNKSTQKRRASAQRAPFPEKETRNEAHTPHTSSDLSSPSSSEIKKPSSSPCRTQSLSLPSPPARIKTTISTGKIPGDEAAIVKSVEDASTSSKGKRHRKCKGKSLLKICSAPSTPRDSRQPQKPFTAASTDGLNDQAARTEANDEPFISHRSTSPQHVLATSRLSRVSMSEKVKKERARRLGQALAATGLLLSLSGLFMGYLSAILGVVCWWYLLPGLRKAVGDKPVVRSHLHIHDSSTNLSNTNSSNAQVRGNKSTKEAGSGKYDLQSHEYKKKVIMEGFLDRGRRSNA